MAHLVEEGSGLKDPGFGRDLHKIYPTIKKGKGNYLYTKDGRKIFDACTGAAVSCIGHGNKKVMFAMMKHLLFAGTPYLSSAYWASDPVQELYKELLIGTENKMSRIYSSGSGSEAMEAAIKVSRQFFFETNKETSRKNFISREGSYHGNTLGALGVSGFPVRQEPYEPYLNKSVFHKISSCNPYRQQRDNESDVDFVARKAEELESKFQELGPDTVVAFIAEPIVGAALGCVPSVPGYLKAMRDICHKHGALFILDEVMCGMGRTGTLHAWQAEDVVPDIQIVAKGLAGGYQSVSAMFISERVVEVFQKNSGQFIHGLTFQAMPIQAIAALEVQRIIKKDRLLENVRKQGDYLEKQLKLFLSDHIHVGDIRGKGLFWGIEFVKDKKKKESFSPELNVAYRIKDLALNRPHTITVYACAGNNDGEYGDRIILAPPYNITSKDVDIIVRKVSGVISEFFSQKL